MQDEYWKRFEKTGYVHDYLNYVQVKSGWQEKSNKEGAGQDESGDSNGNGIVRNANWGI